MHFEESIEAFHSGQLTLLHVTLPKRSIVTHFTHIDAGIYVEVLFQWIIDIIFPILIYLVNPGIEFFDILPLKYKIQIE